MVSLTLSDVAEFVYKTTNYYAQEHECCIRWDDPCLGIRWPLETSPQLSNKDMQGALFQNVVCFE